MRDRENCISGQRQTMDICQKHMVVDNNTLDNSSIHPKSRLLSALECHEFGAVVICHQRASRQNHSFAADCLLAVIRQFT